MLFSDQHDLPGTPGHAATTTRSATALHLWANGVGAVISGDFFGWQTTLTHGFLCGIIALCFATLLYLVLSMSVAEIASLLEKDAGPCHFAEVCFGWHLAFVTGLAEMLKCIIVVGVIATGISNYLVEITQCAPSLSPLIWLIFIFLFTVLNSVGASISTRVQLLITSLSCLLLFIFYIGAVTSGLDLNKYASNGGSNTAFLDVVSTVGIAKVWPFALWFYLGLEELPLAMEITIDPGRNIPRGLAFSFLTLAMLAFLTVFILSSIPPGVEAISVATYPLLIGYEFVFGTSEVVRWCCLSLVIGLIASLHSFIFATGQLIAQMASSGYIPAIMSPEGGVPVVALVTGSVSAFVLNVILYVAVGGNADVLGSVAIAACLFCTLVSYICQLSCFLHLRFYAPNLNRPFQSPFGLLGAMLGLVLCCISLSAILYLSATEAHYVHGLALAAGLLLMGTMLREASWLLWKHEVCEIKLRCSARNIFVENVEVTRTLDASLVSQ